MEWMRAADWATCGSPHQPPVETAMLVLFLLAACEPSKSSPATDTSAPTETGIGPADTDTDVDTGPSGPTPTLPVLATVGSYGVGGLDPTFAGYSAHAGSAGLLWTETASGIIWRCPYEGVGEIDEACEPALAGQAWSIDKMQSTGRALAIADALGAGVAYEVPDDATGALADVALTSVAGGYDGGYTGVLLWLDADGDGSDDDLVATSGLYGDLGWSETPESGYYGELALFLDASGTLAWTDADLYLPACADGGRRQWGPVATATDGTTLAAACPGYGYREGAVEGWALPLTGRPADWSAEASGYYLAARPGGYIADARGSGLVWIQPDGAHVTRELAVDGELPGTAPAVLVTSSGRVLLAVGSQARTSSALGEGSTYDTLGRLVPHPGRLAAGSAEWPWQRSMAGEESYYGGIAVCDITDGWDASLCTVADLPSDGYATCTGAVQGLVEAEDGTIYATSVGWVYGSGDGCGATAWRVD